MFTSRRSLPWAVLALVHAGSVWSAATVDETRFYVEASVPNNASPLIDLSFPGFAFEEASFYLYATDGNGNPNTFSQNLIKEVLNRTGGTPILRVGGTSGDFANYNPSQGVAAIPNGKTAPQLTKPPYLSLGNKFFSAFHNFPGAKFVFQVPLAKRNLSLALDFAEQGLPIIGDSLQAVEIGNEPTGYSWFSVQAYVNEWLEFQKAIVQKFPSLAQQPSFQALDTPSGNVGALPVASAVADGINSTHAIKQVSYHYYQGTDQPGESLAALQDIVNHANIQSKLQAYETDIQWLQQHSPQTAFIMGEVGNTLGKGDLQNRDNLATALWNVDFQLQCMTIGVTRVNMQQIFYPGYSMWESQPGGLIAPSVLANYYSQPMIADFIGPSGQTRVAPLTLQTNASSATMAGYAAYDGGQLARIALVNLHLWAGTGTRPSAQITLTGLPAGTKSVTAQFLTAPEGAYANTTLTWDGLQWSYPSGQSKQVKEDGQTYAVTNGSVTVAVNATSVMVLTV